MFKKKELSKVVFEITKEIIFSLGTWKKFNLYIKRKKEKNGKKIELLKSFFLKKKRLEEKLKKKKEEGNLQGVDNIYNKN